MAIVDLHGETEWVVCFLKCKTEGRSMLQVINHLQMNPVGGRRLMSVSTSVVMTHNYRV